ncbi:MAG: TRAP transporter small permease [Angelakisella sp.]|nr:TRAP transporter small permease [Angelakisella sp.]
MNIVKTIYHVGSKLSDMVEMVLKAILVFLAFGCAFDLLLQVVYRFLLVHFVSFSLTWTNELAQNFIVWMTYLAIGICYKENSMASVNLVYDKLKPRAKFILYLLTRVFIFIFLYVGLKYGWASIQSVSNWTSPSLHLPGYLLYGAPFFGCILMTFEVIVDVLGVLCGELVPFVCRQPEVVEEELSEQEKYALAAIERELGSGELTTEKEG